MLACTCIMQPGCFPPGLVFALLFISASLIAVSAWLGFVTLCWIGRTLWPETHISDRVEPGA